MAGRQRGSLIWVGVLFASALGGLLLLYAIVAGSAPQQAAAAAIGIGFGVLPYVFARAWDEITRDEAPLAVRSVASATIAAEPWTPKPWPKAVKGTILGVLIIVGLLIASGFAVDWYYHPEAYR